MKKIYFLLFLFFAVIINAQTNVGISGNVTGVYINEFHYDNVGADTGEFIEVAGPAGTDLSTYTLTLYNGSDGTSYKNIHLSGLITDEIAGMGTVAFDATNIQNGAPDGIALSKTGDNNIQFISYEGIFTAIDGPAAGLTSVDILVSESGTTTPVGYSLEYDEQTSSWVVSTNATPGVIVQGTALTINQYNDNLNGLKIYPNPISNGILFIETNVNAPKNISIFDVFGKQLMNATVSEGNINIGNLNRGVYFVQITEDGKTATEKLIIE